jgi:hypothetical protein
MIIRPPAVEPDSQLQLRFCRRGVRASLGREVQSERYFTLGLKVLSLRYFAVAGLYSDGSGWRCGANVDAGLCSTVFFQDHA